MTDLDRCSKVKHGLLSALNRESARLSRYEAGLSCLDADLQEFGLTLDKYREDAIGMGVKVTSPKRVASAIGDCMTPAQFAPLICSTARNVRARLTSEGTEGLHYHKETDRRRYVVHVTPALELLKGTPFPICESKPKLKSLGSEPVITEVDRYRAKQALQNSKKG